MAYYGFSLFNRALQSSSGGVEMSSAVEVLLGHKVAGEIIYGTKAYPYDVVMFGIFA